MNAVHRCDRCRAQAYVRVLLHSRRELLFCAHHYRQHASALAEVAVDIQDETQRLARGERPGLRG
jgi:acetyl-CoA carboxylase beta subunit